MPNIFPTFLALFPAMYARTASFLVSSS